MKKRRNWPFIIASVLFCLVIFTSSLVTGLYARYTSSGSGSDEARVAKFGMQITVDDDYSLFNHSYSNVNNEVIVSTSSTLHAIAPGANTDQNKLIINFNGNPEVAVGVISHINTGTMEDIYVKKGTYLDWTTDEEDDYFTLSKDYYPVKWTLKVKDLNKNTEKTIIDAGNLSDVASQLELYSKEAIYKPNSSINSRIVIEWKWDFNESDENNKADTLLSKIAAGIDTSVSDSVYSTNLKYDISIAVSQID